ncbi:MAG: ABC transporter [Lysobacteraceae bacterium]|nr:MAG: ABC transporter [Xanthomonadaceae bacterium]
MSSLSSRARLRIAMLGVALAAPLAGCGILPKQETLSVFRPEPAVTIDPSWAQVGWSLQISRPHVDAAYDSARILVRSRPGELEVYKGVAWTQPAPDLVLDSLLRAFADSGRFAGVARRGEGVKAEYELLLDLRRFEADYIDRDAPSARITLGARLIHNVDNRIVASRVFDVASPADGIDMPPIHRAFERGLEDTTTQLIGWALEQGQRDARSGH